MESGERLFTFEKKWQKNSPTRPRPSPSPPNARKVHRAQQDFLSRQELSPKAGQKGGRERGGVDSPMPSFSGKKLGIRPKGPKYLRQDDHVLMEPHKGTIITISSWF